MSDRARQVRLGLANSLNFLAKQALERRAEEERTQALQRKAQADAVDAGNKLRYQAALDSYKGGNYGALSGITDIARTGNINALSDIAAPDVDAIRNRMNAKDFLPNLLQHDQNDAATDVISKIPGLENIRLGITPKQQGEIDVLGARKLKIETDRKIAEAYKEKKILHLEMLTKAADARLKEIEERTEKARRKGTIDDDFINDAQSSLDDLVSTLGAEEKSYLLDPASYADDEKKVLMPDIQLKLQDTHARLEKARKKREAIADYRFNQLPSAISAERRIPMRDYEAPRQTPEQFRQELMQNLLRGVNPVAPQTAKPKLEY